MKLLKLWKFFFTPFKLHGLIQILGLKSLPLCIMKSLSLFSKYVTKIEKIIKVSFNKLLFGTILQKSVSMDPVKIEAVKIEWHLDMWSKCSPIYDCATIIVVIQDFSKIAATLFRLLQKDEKFVWDDECQKTLDTLKDRLTSYPILRHPDPTRRVSRKELKPTQYDPKLWKKLPDMCDAISADMEHPKRFFRTWLMSGVIKCVFPTYEWPPWTPK